METRFNQHQPILSSIIGIILIFLAACSPRPTISLNDFPDLPNHSNDYSGEQEISSAEAKIGAEKGDKAPDFTILTTDNKEISLSDYAHKKAVLVYFMATWCPYCHKDFTTLSRVIRDYPDVPIMVISLDLSENAKVLQEYKAQFPQLEHVAFAPGKTEILTNYNVQKTTSKYAVNKEGIIFYEGSGEFTEDQWKILLNALKSQG